MKMEEMRGERRRAEENDNLYFSFYLFVCLFFYEFT